MGSYDEALAKALAGESSDDLLKAHVKAYMRKTKTGVAEVKEHDDQRQDKDPNVKIGELHATFGSQSGNKYHVSDLIHHSDRPNTSDDDDDYNYSLHNSDAGQSGYQAKNHKDVVNKIHEDIKKNPDHYAKGAYVETDKSKWMNKPGKGVSKD
jgi:hypothetical protein